MNKLRRRPKPRGHLTIRLRETEREQIERAAFAREEYLTAFIRRAALEKAQRDLAQISEAGP